MQQNLENALHNCKEFKTKYYSKWFNIVFFFSGLFILGGWLYYCYTHKPIAEPPEHTAHKHRTAILKMVANRQQRLLNDTYNKSSEITTGLPDFPNFVMPLPTGSSLLNTQFV